MRSDLHERVKELLAESGFGTVACPGPYSYDMIARKGKKLLFVKTIKSIDNLDDAQVDDLDSLSQELHASTLIIAEDSHGGMLRDGTVYERQGVPAVNFETLKEMLVEDVRPLVRAARGGFYVEIDGPALRQERENLELSLGDFARRIGVSRRHVLQYEKGSATTVDKAVSIEETLERSVLRPVDIFEKVHTHISRELPQFESRVVTKLHSIGFEIGYAQKAPVNVVADEDKERLVSGLGSRGLKNRAKMLRQISDFLEADPVFITERSGKKEVSGIPVIDEKTLKRLASTDELIDRVG